MTDQAQKPTGRIVPWFLAYLAVTAGMAVLINTFDIQDRLLATGLLVAPLVLLVPMFRNSLARAARRGGSGAAQRKYLIRMAVLSLFYLVSLFAAESIIADGDRLTPVTLILALVPGLAVAGYFWAMGRYLIDLEDEFLKMLMVRQSLIGTAITLSAASVWGFLENFGLVVHVDAYWWPIGFFFGIGVGALANYFQYGTTGDCA
ncbi:hypothetical protein [Qipengyuania zhejiangensis]|uniref:hypothetical protein n=1 Tax=Qipengyuania zhejiangensis TaxID=3077782 RepID=UPI002D78A5B7|nr:hypothetical protein [Qipengyuania sp. Z2]